MIEDKCSCDKCNYEVFENDKCILHCDKNSFGELEFFNTLFREYLNSKNEIIDIHFPIGFNLSDFMKGSSSKLFKGCFFYDIFISNSYKFYDCTFLNNLKIISLSGISANCRFVRSTFKSNILFNSVAFNNNFFKECIFSDKKLLFFKNTIFNDVNFLFENKMNIKRFHFSKCRFGNKLSLYELSHIKRLSFFNCIFNERLEIIKCKNIKRLSFRNSEFDSLDKIHTKVKIQFCEIEEGNFFNTRFSDLADFYQTKFKNVNFERADFEKISVFSEVEFSCKVDFKYTKFLGKSIFNDDANFLDVSAHSRKDNSGNFVGEPSNIKVKNRETARVIKNFYDNSNNVIEANRFYEIEMSERKKELSWLKDPLDKFVFSLHEWSSNHSQDWLLSISWIINLSFVFSFLELNLNDKSTLLHIIDCTLLGLFSLIIIGIFISYTKKLLGIFRIVIITSISYLLFGQVNNISLDYIANQINPFSIMTSWDDITFSTLIFRIVIAYLIYQSIISLRQNTKRK